MTQHKKTSKARVARNRNRRNVSKRLGAEALPLDFNECIALKSSVENTWPRCSYPELTMHSGSQLTCSELCPQNKPSQWPSGGPFIESAHEFHKLASQQNDRAAQYEGNAVEHQMLA